MHKRQWEAENIGYVLFFLDQQFVTRCSVAVHMSFNNSYQMRETLNEHRQVVNSWFVSTGHVM